MNQEICPICDQRDWYQPEGKNLWECKNCNPPKNEGQEKNACPSCLGEKFWLPKNSNEWRCEKCHPSPSEFFVAERNWQKAIKEIATQENEPQKINSDANVVVDSYIASYCRPWCTSCGSWQAIETVYGDDRVETLCRVCKAPIPEKPYKLDCLIG